MTDDDIPYEVQQAKEYASSAAECIRSLNHLTLPANGTPGLEAPADVYEIVASLRAAAERSPQLLSQLSGWLWDQERQGRLAPFQGDSFEITLEARTALAEAELVAGLYGEALARVHNALSGVRAAGG